MYVCRGEEGCLPGFWGMERTSAEEGIMPELEYFYICRERQGMGA
ncbi:hypothetical protein [Lacrimispora sp. 210928-DFI.3.58]|nr:hypothetical protein [Lacrimispora sp. 210928-DFI.3.58]